MRRKKQNKKIILALIILLLIVSLIIVFILKSVSSDTKEKKYEEAVLKREEVVKRHFTEDLTGKTEQERMEYYCAQFFKYVSSKDFESAYDLLYSEYKENYFPTIESFKKYMIDYFPSKVSITYNNMERLGNMYILWIHIKDIYNGAYGHDFDMKVVIRENAYNDIDMSFSRDSAVKGLEE